MLRSPLIALGCLFALSCGSPPDARSDAPIEAALDAPLEAAPNARLDAYLRAEASRRQIPGLSVLVSQDHRVVFEGLYGSASLERGLPVTRDTTFEIASMTKAFTAAAVLLLVEQGRLALDDRVGQYLEGLPDTWESMTVEQLMNHTAGLRDDWDEDDGYFQAQTTDAEFLASLQASPLRFAPGTDWSYGCGPFVLGLLIERLSGVSYAEFMRQSIFEPLGMTATAVHAESLDATHHADGYVLRDGVLGRGVRLSPAAHARADVGIRSTARDLARWDAALDGPALLSATSRAAMFSAGRLADGQPIAYGLGWFVTPFRGQIEISHGGGFRTGFNSAIARYPQDGLTVIVLANRYGARVSTLARAVAAFYDDELRPISSMTPRPERASARTAIVARVMTALRDGRDGDDLLPGVGRLGGWSRAEVREALAQATAPVFIDVVDLSGSRALAFGTPLAANSYWRTDGDRPRFWSVGFSADERVAYLELEE